MTAALPARTLRRSRVALDTATPSSSTDATPKEQAVDVLKRRYSSGWEDDAARYPAKASTAIPTPEGRAVVASKWGARHRKRAATAAALRTAGWYVRRFWPRAGTHYADFLDDGTPSPVGGLKVVDPWEVLDTVDGCCNDVVLRPTRGGVHGGVSVAACRCKSTRLCAVCAAKGSTERAEEVRVVAGREGRGKVLHVVLTHRDKPVGEETCSSAWGRHFAAWQRLRTGERGQRWREYVYGACFTFETTGGATGFSWHPHAHGLVELVEGVDVESFRDFLAREWAACTALASVEYGGSESDGWSRESGVVDGVERWASEVPDDEAGVKSACYQIAKYATPLAELSAPSRVAEWVTFSHGRRLVRWLGQWARADVREWIREAVKYQREEAGRLAVVEGNAPDLGERIPGACQPLGNRAVEVAREMGETRLVWRQLDIGRDLEDLEGVREWWRLRKAHADLLQLARDYLTDEDGLDDDTARQVREFARALGVDRREHLSHGYRRLSERRAAAACGVFV